MTRELLPLRHFDGGGASLLRGPFSSVEISYTFYRTPSEKALANWGETTPPGFTFTLKTPRRITHNAWLRDCEDLVEYVLPVRQWEIQDGAGPGVVAGAAAPEARSCCWRRKLG